MGHHANKFLGYPKIQSLTILVASSLLAWAQPVAGCIQSPSLREIDFNLRSCKEVGELVRDPRYVIDIDASDKLLPSDGSSRRCFVASYDLNEDGMSELLVYYEHWCGTHGCPLTIYQYDPRSGYRDMKAFGSGIVTVLPIMVSAVKTQGYHDFVFWSISSGSCSTWEWDGMHYKILETSQ